MDQREVRVDGRLMTMMREGKSEGESKGVRHERQDYSVRGAWMNG